MPDDAGDPLPPCPITGEPAAERLQWISAKLLHDIWRIGARTIPEPLSRDAGRLGLYRSPCGLAFFHPAYPGTGAFYRSLYGRTGAHEGVAAHAPTRGDFAAATALMKPGDSVLEVGAGHGGFARVVPPGVTYQGLEPYGEQPPGGPPIIAETAEAHALRRPGAYDLACAFQVLEHTEDPVGVARAMVACLKPGGHLVAAMPVWPSPHTDLPNNLVNLPPHHLSWWDEGSCRALCDALGLEVIRAAPIPAYPMQAPLVWTWKLCPVRTRPGLYVKASWAWHLSVAGAMWLGQWAARWFGMPRGTPPAVDIVLVARKPG